MKTAKIGAIFLVSVMALAGASAGYAWWSDELHIRGTIETDDFGAEWKLTCVEFSDFIKWHCDVTPEYDPVTGEPIGQPGVDYWILATGSVELADCLGYGECGDCRCKTLWINLSDVFPSNDVMIQGSLEYYGSCPAHLNDIDAWGNLTYEDDTYVDPVGWDDLKWLYVSVEILDASDELQHQTGLQEGSIYNLTALEDLICSQWHDGWYIDFIIYIHFIQWDMKFYDYNGNLIDCSLFMENADDKFDVPQNAKLEFAIDLYFEQWNYNGL